MSKIMCAVALLSALFAASCSAATEVTTTSTIPTPGTAISTTTSLPTSTTEASTTTTTTLALGSGPLEDLEGTRRSGEFWYVGPGQYTLSMLPEVFDLSLGEEYSFVILSQAFVAFAEPGFLPFLEAPSLTLAELSGFAEPSVNDQGGLSDPPLVPFGDDADVTLYFEDTEPFILIGTGTDTYLGGEVSWWEFTIDPAASDGGFRCAFSASCYNVVVQPEHGNFVVAPGWVFRLWRIEAGESTVWGFMQTPEDQVGEGVALSEAILSGLALG